KKKHIITKRNNPAHATLFLLNCTCGTEHDLLSLAAKVDSDANVLIVRGNISENGIPRFFKKLAEGVFDEEDLIFRTKELYDFLDEAAGKYDFDRANIYAIGYSNG